MSSATEFLVTSLLADALLLDEWGAHAEDQEPQSPEALHSAASPPSNDTGNRNSDMFNPLTPSESTSLSPATALKTSKEADANAPAAPVSSSRTNESTSQAILEMRRRRNCESMQRARRKQRDDIGSMRKTLETLTFQFEQLRQQQQRNINATRSTSPSDLPMYHTQLESAYGTLAETSHRLQAENFLLQRLIVEHEKTKLRLIEAIKNSNSTIMTTIHEKHLVAMATPHHEPAAQFFEFTDISPEQAQAAISSCYQRIAQYEETALPLAHCLLDAGDPCSAFGWAVSGDISTGNNFFLSMTKRLPGVSPEEALQRSWAIMSRARRADKSPSRRLVRSAVLQKINDSMCVVGDDLYHPIKADVRMRTITVRFRMATDRGFAVGLGTINPQNPVLRRHHQPAMDYMDVFSWHDFAHDEDGTGCVVTLKGLTQYDTNENLRMRLSNALCSTCRWESEVTRIPMRFLAI